MGIANFILLFLNLCHTVHVFIKQQVCTSHITKGLGTGLRTLVKRCKEQILSDGKGEKEAYRHSSVYLFIFFFIYFFGRGDGRGWEGVVGAARRINKVNSQAMSKTNTTLFYLKHYSSSSKIPRHEDYPEDEISQCSYNRDSALVKAT